MPIVSNFPVGELSASAFPPGISESPQVLSERQPPWHGDGREGSPPRKRLGRRLTAQSLELPRSSAPPACGGAANGFGGVVAARPAHCHAQPSWRADSEAATRAPTRQLALGGSDALFGGSAPTMRLMRHVRASGDAPLSTFASRSVDGGGNNVFAQQLAAVRASTPAAPLPRGGGDGGLQPRGALKRLATTGHWASALVPPVPAGAELPATDHRRSEVSQVVPAAAQGVRFDHQCVAWGQNGQKFGESAHQSALWRTDDIEFLSPDDLPGCHVITLYTF